MNGYDDYIDRRTATFGIYKHKWFPFGVDTKHLFREAPGELNNSRGIMDVDESSCAGPTHAYRFPSFASFLLIRPTTCPPPCALAHCFGSCNRSLDVATECADRGSGTSAKVGVMGQFAHDPYHVMYAVLSCSRVYLLTKRVSSVTRPNCHNTV